MKRDKILEKELELALKKLEELKRLKEQADKEKREQLEIRRKLKKELEGMKKDGEKN